MMPAPLLGSTGGTALWYLTRATGVVGLVLLTGTVVIGVVASVGWTRDRWPRFFSQHVHRNLSLLCLGFVAVHVATTVGDGYVPIDVADAFVPFRSPYRPLWVGLGALALDLLLAVLMTSALRHRIGYANWRFVHWLAYACWPIAVLHGLGTGSDASLGPVLAVDATCTAVVLAAVAWRLATGRTFGTAQRLAAAILAVVVVVAIGAFAALGPLSPGWSHRAGTSSALLARIAAKNTGVPVVPAPSTTVATSTPVAPVTTSGQVPATPFTVGVTGSQTTTSLGGGRVRITLALHLGDPTAPPLTIVLEGAAAPGGGVSLADGSVDLGPDHGTVASLHGDTVVAVLAGDAPIELVVTLRVDQGTGALSGTVTGTRYGTGP